jgi:transcriptional regulator with XRE-family HTH domain
MLGFAEAARQARIAKRLSLRALSEQLQLSVIYLSDMETGRRMPPSPDIAREWAKALDLDPEGFATLALRGKKVVELPIEGQTELKKDVAARLARSWDTLTEEQQSQLAEALAKIVEERD